MQNEGVLTVDMPPAEEGLCAGASDDPSVGSVGARTPAGDRHRGVPVEGERDAAPLGRPPKTRDDERIAPVGEDQVRIPPPKMIVQKAHEFLRTFGLEQTALRPV